MDLSEIRMAHHHQLVTDRFVAACRVDARVVAAFLGGSYATGTADAYSDLDLYLITTDAAYENFVTGREVFISQLGEPLFLEDFGTPHAAFFILVDGTEGELWIGRESHFKHIHGGAYTVLFDDRSILTGVVFSRQAVDPAGQIETLRQQIAYFWHDIFHFIKAMGRGQLWFAYGQLEVIRQICINLARLRHSFADPDVGEEPYFKVEEALPVEQLAPLQATFCPMEFEAMLQAGLAIFHFYRDLASELAQEHGIPYQVDLGPRVLDHLGKLSMMVRTD